MKREIILDAYTEGKRAYLDGKGKEDYPHEMNEGSAHNFRMGWRCAETNKQTHPEWTDREILETVSF